MDWSLPFPGLLSTHLAGLVCQAPEMKNCRHVRAALLAVIALHIHFLSTPASRDTDLAEGGCKWCWLIVSMNSSPRGFWEGALVFGGVGFERLTGTRMYLLYLTKQTTLVVRVQASGRL